MAMRPGDSAPNFDKIERHLNPEESSEEETASPEGDAQEGSPDLPDSHVFQMPAMVPHMSDGTTDVLEKGREPPAGSDDKTEPLFPRQPASEVSESEEPVPDDESTVELARVVDSDAAKAVVEGAVATSGAASSASNPPEPRPNNFLFLLLLSYASAVTIGLVYLLATRGTSGPDRHQLEDLRDPVDEEGVVRIYQRDAELPPGHVLRLAESRQFGNILVEPVRVTRGPVQFEHYSHDLGKSQPPSPPVCKLWLKLTNVSKDQEIAPLDALLLFKREMNRDGELVSNTFLAPTGKQKEGPIVFSYPAAQNSEWDMVGQDLGRKLAPAESIETFIPSDHDGLAELDGKLVWRFHLRKGYAPSGRGVTTLVEVAFASDDIETEPEEAPQPASSKQRKKSRKPKTADASSPLRALFAQPARG